MTSYNLPELKEAASAQTDPAPTAVYVGPTETSKAVQAPASTYDATTRDVGENELASNRLNTITRQDSPLMQRARSQAAEFSNKRGLQNSSIAAGTSMGAMVDRATPLAQQEAQTFSNQELANQQFENRASEVNANTGAQFEMSNVEAANRAAMLDTEVEQRNEQFNTETASRTDQFNTGLTQNRSMFNAQESNRQIVQGQKEVHEASMQVLKGNQSVDLLNIEASYKNLLQTNASASQIYVASLGAAGQLLGAKLSGTATNTGLRALNTATRSALDAIDGFAGVNLGGFSFTTAQPQNNYTYTGIGTTF